MTREAPEVEEPTTRGPAAANPPTSGDGPDPPHDPAIHQPPSGAYRYVAGRSLAGPTGPLMGDMAWGDGSAGAANLSTAILEEQLGNKPDAGMVYAFKWDVVALLPPRGDWTIPCRVVDAWVDQFFLGRRLRQFGRGHLVPVVLELREGLREVALGWHERLHQIDFEFCADARCAAARARLAWLSEMGFHV